MLVYYLIISINKISIHAVHPSGFAKIEYAQWSISSTSNTSNCICFNKYQLLRISSKCADNICIVLSSIAVSGSLQYWHFVTIYIYEPGLRCAFFARTIHDKKYLQVVLICVAWYGVSMFYTFINASTAMQIQYFEVLG